MLDVCFGKVIPIIICGVLAKNESNSNETEMSSRTANSEKRRRKQKKLRNETNKQNGWNLLRIWCIFHAQRERTLTIIDKPKHTKTQRISRRETEAQRERREKRKNHDECVKKNNWNKCAKWQQTEKEKKNGKRIDEGKRESSNVGPTVNDLIQIQ